MARYSELSFFIFGRLLPGVRLRRLIPPILFTARAGQGPCHDARDPLVPAAFALILSHKITSSSLKLLSIIVIDKNKFIKDFLIIFIIFPQTLQALYAQISWHIRSILIRVRAVIVSICCATIPIRIIAFHSIISYIIMVKKIRAPHVQAAIT